MRMVLIRQTQDVFYGQGTRERSRSMEMQPLLRMTTPSRTRGSRGWLCFRYVVLLVSCNSQEKLRLLLH